MGPEIAIYPFLFIALFFETFVLVTFLSKPAREARVRLPSTRTPQVALIIPCYNEADTVAKTVESALALLYPKDKLSVILVNDGSTDATREVMERFRGNPQITIIHKENGGKHTALNAGIAATNAEIVGCLDADSFVEPDALGHILTCFENPKVAAATAAMSIHKPKRLIEQMQNAEYIFGIFLRHALCSINAIYVTPGPFSLYRRDVVVALGGFRFGQQTEDMEMALRIQRAGYWIDNAPRARVYTNAPTSVSTLVKQRVRWTSGFMRNMIFDYRDLIGNYRFGTLGLLVLPLGIISLIGGMGLFFLSIYLFIKNAVDSYQIRRGVPFDWSSFVPTSLPSIDWFYTPLTFLTLLALVTGAIAVTMIFVGKRISGTPGRLTIGVIGYTLFYGMIAPFWLMKATADVVTGTRRGWR